MVSLLWVPLVLSIFFSAFLGFLCILRCFALVCFGLFGFLGGQDLVFLGFHRFLGVVLFIFLDSWDVAAIAANNHKQHHKLTSINCRVSL